MKFIVEKWAEQKNYKVLDFIEDNHYAIQARIQGPTFLDANQDPITLCFDFAMAKNTLTNAIKLPSLVGSQLDRLELALRADMKKLGAIEN